MTSVSQNAAKLAAARVISIGLNTAVWVYLARVLTPDRFGVIGFGQALVSYFVLAVALGFDAVGTREAARDEAGRGDLVGHLLALRLTLATVATAVYLTVVAVIPMPPLHRAVLAALALQIAARAVLLDWLFVGIERMGAVAAREVAAAALAAVGAFAFVRSPDNVALAAALVAGAPLVSGLGLVALYRQRHGSLRLRVDRAAWVRLIRPALPLAASALMIEVYTNLDRVMLEAFRDTTEVGWYTAAYRAVWLAMVPSWVFYQAFFPTLAAALGDRPVMRERGVAFARAMLAFGIPIALAGPVLADSGLRFVFGDAYAPGGPALAVLLVTAGVMTFNMSLGTPLMAWDRETDYFRAVIAGAVVNVGLNLVLIPRLGGTGAAWATLASEGAVGIGLAWAYRREVGRLPWRPALRPVPAALLGATLPAVWGVRQGWPLLATVAACLAGYGLLAVATGVVAWPRRAGSGPPAP